MQSLSRVISSCNVLTTLEAAHADSVHDISATFGNCPCQHECTRSFPQVHHSLQLNLSAQRGALRSSEAVTPTTLLLVGVDRAVCTVDGVSTQQQRPPPPPPPLRPSSLWGQPVLRMQLQWSISAQQYLLSDIRARWHWFYGQRGSSRTQLCLRSSSLLKSKVKTKMSCRAAPQMRQR